MRKTHLLSFVLIVVLACCSPDSSRNKNPYLPTYRFQSSIINLNLPLYTPLKSVGNPIEYYEVGVGIRDKVFVMNAGSTFVAFDAVCPNQSISECSLMELLGIKALCPCDEVEYSLFSGQGQGVRYPMVQYRVEILDENTIRIYN